MRWKVAALPGPEDFFVETKVVERGERGWNGEVDGAADLLDLGEGWRKISRDDGEAEGDVVSEYWSPELALLFQLEGSSKWSSQGRPESSKRTPEHRARRTLAHHAHGRRKKQD